MHSAVIDNRGENQKEKNLPLDEIVKAVKSIKYGYVQVIVQNSKVVQIDKTEKIRLDK